MPRLNGVPAILEYLGYKSRKVWRHLVKEHDLPFYRDRDDPKRVWALTSELDAWDARQSVKNGRGVK